MPQDWFSQFESTAPKFDPWFDQFNKKPDVSPPEDTSLLARARRVIDRVKSKIPNIDPTRPSGYPSLDIDPNTGKQYKVATDVPNFFRKGTDWLANKIDPNDVADRGRVKPFIAGAIQGVGNIFDEGLNSPFPKPIPRINPAAVEQGINQTRAARNALGLDRPNRLELPPSTPPEPRQFIGGPAGLAEKGKTYPLDLGQHPDLFSGTVTPQEFGGVNQVPADLAARRGTGIGNTTPFPNNNPLEQIRQFTEGKPIEIPNPRDYYPGKVGLPYELESAPRKPVTQPVAKPQIKPTATVPEVPSTFKPAPIDDGVAKSSLYRKISKDAPTRNAIEQWAYGQEGARVKGSNLKEQFKDLSDPSLIDKYEAGDRSGRLADVQKTLDELHQKGTEAGIFKEGQKQPNYLRHEYEQNPEEVATAVKNYVSKNPSIAKTRRFPSYAVAEGEGLKRKYNTIPELLETYNTKLEKAARNKEFYDYLTETKQLKAGKLIESPNSWIFQGKNKKELEQLVGNVLTKSPKKLNQVANAVSWTKNLYLGSGIPKTPLNMHMYNITRSDMTARGIKHGLGDFVSGIINPARDRKTIESNRGLLAELVDHGYGHSIEEHSIIDSPSKVRNILNKATDMQQRIFEDPLFKIHLPAVKLRFANERVSELLKRGVSRDNALTQAATEANDFYGGINKILRNKTYNDLARIGLLAPDWLESRARLAGKGVAALVGKSDPLYAKALGRSLGMRAAGAGVTLGLTGSILNQSKRATNTADIPAGKTSTGLNRDIPILGSAAEGIRIPEELLSGRDFGDIAYSRTSQPLKAAINIARNEDAFHNPLRGQDKYGRPISKVRGAINTAKEATGVITPPWVTMLQQVLSGQDPEAAIATGLELPLKYNREPSEKRLRLR